jgi:hypothetical protein
MNKRLLCLLLVSVFLLQSAVAGVQSYIADSFTVDHHSTTVVMDHAQYGTDQTAPYCDLQQHGHCCHGHFGVLLLLGYTFNISVKNNRPASDYAFFVSSSPTSELLRPPAV